jgi:hypothetical protein
MTVTDPARPADGTMAGLVAGLIERAFASASSLRGARVFHPHGRALSGRLDGRCAPFAELLDSGEQNVIVCVSRGIGLPDVLPDIHGIAVRFVHGLGPGRPLDLLLVSSGSVPGCRHLLAPVRRWTGVTYTSLLPYEHEGGLVMMGATLHSAEGLPLVHADDVADAAARDGLELGLLWSSIGGPWHTVASIQLDAEHLSDAVQPHFDPWHTPERLRPWSAINRLRGPAYRGSRSGTARTPRRTTRGVTDSQDIP